MWWLPHLWVIALQVITVVPYAIASYRFYHEKDRVMFWLLIGILLDVAMALLASSGVLPRMKSDQGAPWTSIAFIIHISTAGLGMFGFIGMFFYLLFHGVNRPYLRLRKFQYFVFLRLWIFGVGIAILNFMIKVFFGTRLYDLV